MKLKFLRIICLVAFALVVSMLWGKWQALHSPATPAVQQAASANSVPNLAPSATTSQTPAKPEAAPSTGQIIRVNTDVLAVSIDTVGGNMVQADLLNYPAKLHSDQAVVLLNNNPNSLYIAQSGIIGNGIPQNPVFTAAQSRYTLTGDTLNVDLTWKSKSLTLIKRYTFTRGLYAIKVQYLVANRGASAVDVRFYGQLMRMQPQSEHSFLGTTYTGAAVSTPSDHYQKLSFKAMAEQNLDTTAQGGWVAMLQHYFISAWIPDSAATNQYYTQSFANNTYAVGMATPSVAVPANGQAQLGASLYVGPTLVDQLKAAAPYLNLTVDYGWLWFISQLLFWLLTHIHYFVGNWGVAIILLTVLIKIVFYPLSAKSYKSMAKMRRLQPKMTQLRERYADDKQKLSRAIMELYRDEKVNPLGGCLPMIVQIPVFIALYWVLMESVELRQAPFFLWIHDLSAHDPYYILPVLMGASMFLQQRLNPSPPDPMQAKMLMFMPLIFTIMFLSFPAGLVLYWLVNNCISILQQWYITRKYA